MSKPEKEFRCGQVRASVWLNERNVQGEVVNIYSVRIEKAYKDGDDWKSTTSFAVDDLPMVALVASEAYKHIRLRTKESSEGS